MKQHILIIVENQNIEYLMNKNGFSLIVMGFTGKKAIQWKIEYITAFEQMEQYLKQLQVSSIDKKFLIVNMMKFRWKNQNCGWN